MPRLSNEAADVIAQALARGLSRTQIAGVVGVSSRVVSRVKANLKKYGTPQAPNIGTKIGRPIMMSEEQAEALMQWMRERNYSFYIKDALDLLTTHYGYKGVHGTVRRFLIRSGFKRKLPAPRAEVTTWLPPETLPPMKSVLDGTYNAAADNEDDDSEDDDDDDDDENDDTIDPELQDSRFAQPSTDPQPSNSFPLPLASVPQQTTPVYQNPPQNQPQPHPNPPSENLPSMPTPTPTSSTKRRQKRRKTGSGTNGEDEIVALKQEVARQNAIIQDLQRQLAQAQAQAHAQAQSGPSQTSVNDLTSAHLLAQFQQHG